jgi:restriction endonuclease S subunit
LLHHIIWAAEQGHFADMKTQTTIAHLTNITLNSYFVVLPPLSLQEKVAIYLDNMKAKLDLLRSTQKANAAELDALLPSILDRAFKGEL